MTIFRMCFEDYCLENFFMLCDVDYFFTYKYSLRFVLLHKVDCFANTYKMPFLQRLVVFFYISELADLNDTRVFNYFFLLRFFFGHRSFFTKLKSSFASGRSLYSFCVQSFFRNRLAYFPLFFLVNDILFLVNKKHYSFYLHGGEYGFSLYDLNLFLEKKHSMALFNLQDFLQYRLFFSCNNFKFYFILMDLFKAIR